MKFCIEIKDSSNPFYKSCKNNGQAMGMATPFLLEESKLFSLVYKENGKPQVVDLQGKTYQTHHSKGSKFFINPSYQKGFGRSFQKEHAHEHICKSDYHLFTNLKNDVLECVVLSTADTFHKVDKDSGEIVVEF